MTVIYYDRNEVDRTQQQITTSSITIPISADVDIEIRIDKFGCLVIQKQQYGKGESSLIINPCVSNEIKIS